MQKSNQPPTTLMPELEQARFQFFVEYFLSGTEAEMDGKEFHCLEARYLKECPP